MLRDTQNKSLGAAMALGGVAQFLVAFDASVTNVALRSIRDDVHFTDTGLSWVVNAYAIAFGGLLLLGGRLTDRFGPRAVLRVGFAVFTLASLAAYLCSEPWHVVAVRILQGVGAAASAPAALTAVAITFHEPAQRAKAFGAVAIGSTAGGALGVVFSGLITDAFGWRTVIASGAVIAVVGLLLSFAAPGPAPANERRTDWLGGILATAGLSLLTYGIVAATDNGWISGRTVGIFVGAVALLVAFVVVERKVAVPLVDFRLFARRAVLVPSLVLAVVTAGQFGSFYFISLYLQMGLGKSASQTGLMFLPFCFALVVAIAVATTLMPRLGARTVVVAGALIAAVGFLLFAPLPTHGGFVVAILLPSLVTAFGIGMTFVPLPNIATAAVEKSATGMVSGLVNVSRQMGGAIGLAILVTVAASINDTGGSADVLPGYRGAVLVSAGLLVLGAIIALFLPRSSPAAPAQDAATDDEGEPALP